MKIDTKKLSDIKVGGIDLFDANDFVDAYIESAYYQAENRNLSESELDEISEDRDFVYECLINQIQ